MPGGWAIERAGVHAPGPGDDSLRCSTGVVDVEGRAWVQLCRAPVAVCCAAIARARSAVGHGSCAPTPLQAASSCSHELAHPAAAIVGARGCSPSRLRPLRTAAPDTTAGRSPSAASSAQRAFVLAVPAHSRLRCVAPASASWRSQAHAARPAVVLAQPAVQRRSVVLPHALHCAGGPRRSAPSRRPRRRAAPGRRGVSVGVLAASRPRPAECARGPPGIAPPGPRLGAGAAPGVLVRRGALPRAAPVPHLHLQPARHPCAARLRTRDTTRRGAARRARLAHTLRRGRSLLRCSGRASGAGLHHFRGETSRPRPAGGERRGRECFPEGGRRRRRGTARRDAERTTRAGRRTSFRDPRGLG
ncbi:hypothetical protein PsYK624_135700 [Phanerochaete sordida]|uniref:Uncharacterized protein n=1 Tax=Phanerochaete sordida TaxID=48140 RepID=A0A9P3GPZ3_9APHY|nr:hypothetical protein PsYK624_135700 [Phanerochaete sordida]